MRRSVRVLLASWAVSACAPDATTGSDTPFEVVDTSTGDALSDVETVALPRLGVVRDGTPVAGDAAFNFGGAIQGELRLTFVLRNDGSGPLNLASIAWEGEHNRYVSFQVEAVPRDLAPGDATDLTIVFAPPIGMPLDDFSTSVLLITSNATDAAGTPTPVRRLTFEIDSTFVGVRVTPSSYVFRNATPARPERQAFRIYNEGNVEVVIDGVTLETSSTEFTLSGTPTPGTVLRAPGSPSYSDIVFDVTYVPSGDTASANAIIVAMDGEDIRVPLTSESTVGDYAISYSHPSELDFSGTSQPSTRSVLLTSTGEGPITVRQPRIEPSAAGVGFALSAWLVGTNGGDDQPVSSWPRGLQSGRSLRFDVTYTPGPNAIEGQLVVLIETPSLLDLTFDLTP